MQFATHDDIIAVVQAEKCNTFSTMAHHPSRPKELPTITRISANSITHSLKMTGEDQVTKPS